MQTQQQYYTPEQFYDSDAEKISFSLANVEMTIADIYEDVNLNLKDEEE